ncbi:hypothetical protein QFX18_03435 [Saccharophagus degradans]|uniref:hypothetical protein n=1 Tax=Saccharophagus degradans TaxID=86304 RepID=UPI0024782968|nr:hypothetical protein [Saccharophagus degradans]WGO99112.1 hypothetical protein QFX18_03435 [Saccharophagus degradans]
MKKYLVFLIFIIGGCMGESKLMEEIKSLPKPANFEQVSINSILEKYINIGMLKGESANFFTSVGFSSFVKDGDETEVGEKIYWILYLEKTLSSPAKYKIVVEVDYVDQKVSGFSGVYLKNMY